MPLQDFYDLLWTKEHGAYDKSILRPVAPEYTTGEVLLGATYRKLLLGQQEANVDLNEIDTLPDKLAPQQQAWKSILKSREGLASPSLSGQRSTPPPQLMPLVPEIARYGCVLGGRPRSRWDPGNLLLSTLGSGLGPNGIESIIERLREVLAITDQEDVFAKFVENSLDEIADGPKDDLLSLDNLEALAWRASNDLIRTPAEQFSEDLNSIIGLKEHLTRRQWTVLLEALLRIGLATHMLWLCRANKVVWHMVLKVLGSDTPAPDALAIEKQCWEGHDNIDPLLELGRDGIPFIKKRLQEFIQARLGLNLLLHALEDADHSWPNPIGVSPDKNPQPAPELIAAFLSHVESHKSSIQQIVQQTLHEPSLRNAAQTIADSNPRLLGSQSGPTKNLYEFLRYSLRQLQPMESEMSSYDQSYVLYKKNRRQNNSPWPVQPGPAALIMLVHSCCKSLGRVPASIDYFRNYLANYGILAPAGELQGGQTGRDLERLGLVVDSPDAGGGRLLVYPFKRSA